MAQFKKFTSETIESAEFNDYIASQVVGTFDSASARSAYFAGGGAFTVTEGMVTYLKDTGEFQVYKSTGWTTIGATGATGATGAAGATGATGATGPAGAAGAAASITLGAVTTGEPGSDVAITNTGSSSAAVFNFAIPRGLQGPTGAAGSNGSTGATGATGAEGPRGQAATINVGSVVTGDEGSSAEVTNSGNTTDAVFDFIIPKGDAGTIAVGTVTTGGAGTNVEVTNSGTAKSAILNFVIPAGPQGASGDGSGDVVAANANTFTTNQIISGSTTAALLRITQTGTGNALVVEDETNPDSTPTIIDATGRIVRGHTTWTNIGLLTEGMQTHRNSGTEYGGLGLIGWRNNAALPAALHFAKSNSTVIGTQAAVTSGTDLGRIGFYGSDGTDFIASSLILGEADATPSTGIVPGRLVFSTADSTGTLTERMRINSAGAVTIGSGTATAGVTVQMNKTITGSTSSFGLVANGAIQSDATSVVQMFRSAPSTVAASFTLTTLTLYHAQGITTPGAGSTITNQYGFNVNSTMTGATNNYGYFSTLAAATNRWNLYMEGTAANYMSGRLGVGATLTSGAMAQVTNTTAADKAFVVKGAASQTGDLLDIQNSAGTTLTRIDSAGRLIMNYSSAFSIGTGTPSLQVNSGGSGTAFFGRWSNNGQAAVINLAKSRSGAVGSFSTVLADDVLGQITAYGADGTEFVLAGTINVRSEGAISTGVVPGRIEFTTANSAGTNTERMRIDSAGNLLVGMTTIATASAKTVHIGNGTAPTADPTGGGVLYVESGALKYRGSSGTVTTLGAA